MFKTIIEKIVAISSSLQIPDIILLTVSIFSLVVLSLTFNKAVSTFFQGKARIKPQDVRKVLSFLILLFITTFSYLVIDTYIFHLPDPIIPYVIYILLFTIFLGIKISIFLSIISIFLIEYYLYEPRYIFGTVHHPVDIIYTALGLITGVIIGEGIRKYQQTLVKKTEELDVLIKARDQFSAIAAHELKTPLTTISLYSQILNKRYKNKNASKVLQDSVQTITHEAEKLTYMINDLLDFSRMQSSKLQLNKEVFNLADLFRDRIQIAQALYPDHKYIFKQQVRDTTIYADRLTLDRVITNLLTNAGKYSRSQSIVKIDLKKNHKDFIVSVKDKGVGIDKNYMEKLFEPFYQVENGKKGLGLGLHIARSIVELHGGKIWVESKPDRGSTFFVSLPINSLKNKS